MDNGNVVHLPEVKKKPKDTVIFFCQSYEDFLDDISKCPTCGMKMCRGIEKERV